LAEAQASGERKRGLTEGQAAKLIALNQAILNTLTGIKNGAQYPEATNAALQGRVTMEIL
jgi:hypothetical protein